jgi:hypothetical protein
MIHIILGSVDIQRKARMVLLRKIMTDTNRPNY